MKSEYHQDSDMLCIGFSNTPSVESEEVADGFVLDYAANGEVVGIEVEHASRRLDLQDVQVGGANTVQADRPYNRHTKVPPSDVSRLPSAFCLPLGNFCA